MNSQTPLSADCAVARHPGHFSRDIVMNSDTLLSADTPLSDENNGDLLCSSAGETVPARVAPPTRARGQPNTAVQVTCHLSPRCSRRRSDGSARARSSIWREHLTTDQKVGGSSPSEHARTERQFRTHVLGIAPSLQMSLFCSHGRTGQRVDQRAPHRSLRDPGGGRRRPALGSDVAALILLPWDERRGRGPAERACRRVRRANRSAASSPRRAPESVARRTRRRIWSAAWSACTTRSDPVEICLRFLDEGLAGGNQCGDLLGRHLERPPRRLDDVTQLRRHAPPRRRANQIERALLGVERESFAEPFKGRR